MCIVKHKLDIKRKLVNTRCPHCQHKLDAATEAEVAGKEVPKAGDISLCFYCGGVSNFVEAPGDMIALEKVSDEEWLDFPSDLRAKLQRVSRDIIEFRKRKEHERHG